MKAQYFVYIDFTDDGRPFYVGKGKKERVKLRDRNTVWKRIAAKHGWRRHVFAQFDKEADAFLIEQALVFRHGTFMAGPGGVWGANLTAGGEGISGMRVQRTPEWQAKLNAAQKGKSRSAETRAKMSAAKKGKPSPKRGVPMSDEQKAKISAAKKGKPGKPISDAQKALVSAVHKGKKLSEETKAKMRATRARNRLGGVQ